MIIREQTILALPRCVHQNAEQNRTAGMVKISPLIQGPLWMARQYSDGGRNSRGSFGRPPQEPFAATSKSLKERVGALKNLRPFAVMVWRASPQLPAASLV